MKENIEMVIRVEKVCFKIWKVIYTKVIFIMEINIVKGKLLIIMVRSSKDFG